MWFDAEARRAAHLVDVSEHDRPRRDDLFQEPDVLEAAGEPAEVRRHQPSCLAVFLVSTALAYST